MNREEFLLSVFALVTGAPPGSSSEGLRGAYIDSRYQTAIPFGTTSPYLQPWRAYQETLPASALRNALGINLNLEKEDPNVICQHLARCGFRHARIEISWGSVFEGSAETEVAPGIRARFAPMLRACRDNKIRPLILLNANHGLPCPTVNSVRTLARPARKGDRTAVLKNTQALKAGYSGFNNVTQPKIAEILFTRIEPNGTVHLSRPLPKDLGDTGKEVSVGTLRYRPFGAPDSPDYAATRKGWQRYITAVARFAAETLTPGSSEDRGFDMEIWNELSFGSDFLSLASYYDPAPKYESDIFHDLVRATVEVATASRTTFTGVLLCDGFGNTIPWTNASEEPGRMHALSKHPYVARRTYQGKPEQPFPVVNALFKPEDKPGFYPTYTISFPEYYANALQTEHIIRDLSPITTDVGPTKHGRFAQPGTSKPFRTWFTEWGVIAKEWGVDNDQAAQNLKARAYARALCFWVGKGLERLYFYAVRGGDNSFGLVTESFLQRAETAKQLPANEGEYRSSVLATMKRLMDAFAGADFKNTRALKVEDIRDTHGHYQWRGDGTPAHPTLYNRECVAFLPFQVSDTRYVIPYYVQTRDMSKSLPPEQYTVIVSGFRHPDIDMISRVYDPVTGRTVSGAKVLSVAGNGKVSFSLPATDYPYLLILDDPA